MAKPFSFLVDYADKILLLAVPYLACVSVLYYGGYWGVLGIDVYNYFALSDLIKGAAYPMQFVLAAAVVGALADLTLSQLIVVFVKVKLIRGLFWIMMSLFILSLFVCFCGLCVVAFTLLLGKEPSGLLARTFPFLHVPFYAAILIIFIGTTVINKVMSKSQKQEKTNNTYGAKKINIRLLVRLRNTKSSIDLLTGYVFYIALVTTPLFSFTSGYYTAKDVMKGRVFDYIEPQVFKGDTVLAKYKYIKYLGKVGDYHFLLTPDNQRRIVIEKDHWPVLLLLSSSTVPPVRTVGPLPKKAIATPLPKVK